MPVFLVRKKMTEMLDICKETNTRPSVLMLALHIGLTNTTFCRRYQYIARELAEHRATPEHRRDGPSEHDKLVARNAKLRRRNRDLTAQLALAAAQIQHLALRAARMQEVLAPLQY
ncbi:hypothetical protein ABZ835_43130 [Streptomyces sp. NPDC047461]|uniref:hypothetical protein n=1 Tax=Streptomyces sp. NPDC047461 TaxID=3155619 RepID=UPI0033D2219E